MLPCIAESMSASVGFGFALSSATADMIWPDWQKPHWGTSTSIHAFCTGCALVADNPSMVVTFLPATAEIGVTQERTGWPSTCTVHAPHCAMPQPYLVPVRLRFSRTTHSSGTSGATSTCCGVPLTVSEIMASPPCRPLNDGPARPGERDAGARQQPFADLLDAGEEARFVDERLAVGVDHHAAVDDDRVETAPVRVVDKIVDGIEERLPFRTLRVEEQDVGALAGLDRAQRVTASERRGAAARGHLERGLGGNLPHVLPRVLVLDGGHVHGAHEVEVVRVVRRVAAERD